ncbi:MAG: glycoside hydrolase family 3 N-terminal domain-containing protein [Acidimicrobiia bacterium]
MTSELTPISSTPVYRDAALPVERRVEDLLDRMTIDEKLAQLGSAWVFQFLTGDDLADGRVREMCPFGIGQVTRIAGASGYRAHEAAHVANQIQRQLMEETRLGIPAIVHEEICSGLMGRDSTVFPQAIGVASSFEPELNRAIADSIRDQMRHMGSHQGLSPVLDVARDPRWGRTEETYGEDPYLVARMGGAFIQGLQGVDLKDGVVATAKHFVGYGASEGGMNWAPAHVADRELREVYLHPFEAAVRHYGVHSVMNAYNELDGVPGAANRELLNGRVRMEWGFAGTIVSDYFSIAQLHSYHGIARDKRDAAALALTAGIDVELPSTDAFGHPLLDALHGGRVDIELIDDAVRRTLWQKFALGLFEDPYVDEGAAPSHVDTGAQHRLALDVARKSMVLLRNDGVLPLTSPPGKVAVIGPNADAARHLYGDYAYPAHVESLREAHAGNNVFHIPIPTDFELSEPEVETPSLLEALRSRLGESVRYARGCGVNDADRSGFPEAAALAAWADVVVLVVGDRAGSTDSCTSGEGRDRSSLDLPGVQEELARLVLGTGTPVVTVLVVGRPCGSVALHERSAAVLLAWLPGQAGAQAIVDTLDGTFNPGGKLPITFPRSAGQLPVYYGHKVSGGRSQWMGDYVDGPASPLYPFGHGLSYSTIRVFDARVEPPNDSIDGVGVVTASVANEGSVAGDEVVQVYVANRGTGVTRPVLELKAFARVSVEPGSSRSVRFEIPLGQLGYYDVGGQYVIAPGIVEFMVGSSSANLQSAGRVMVEYDGPIDKRFDGTVSVV